MLMMPPPPPRAQLRIESWFEGDGIGGDAVRLVRISNWFASRTYGRLLGMPRDEYCPLTRSLDLFGDRWGLLVVRELLRGVTRFNELERSLPGISRSTLAQRLRHLEREAIVERTSNGGGVEYRLSDRGLDLVSVLESMAGWGVRWLVPQARPSEIDRDGLMQWVRRHVVLRELPADRVVIRFELRGRGRHYYWLILRPGEASLCAEHPGFDEDLFVTARPIDLYHLVTGQQSLADAVEDGSVKIDGPPALVRSLPRWFLLRASGPPLTVGPAA
jgi:DNA-binding HxlR family transcriptional regulator